MRFITNNAIGILFIKNDLLLSKLKCLFDEQVI